MTSVSSERYSASEPFQAELTGLDLIATAARKLLKESHPPILDRIELAKSAGVSPALVRYYLQDYSAFLSIVSRSAIEDYAGDLNAILRGDGAHDLKLRSIVILLMRIYRDDDVLLDRYLGDDQTLSSRQIADPLLEAVANLRDFFRYDQDGHKMTRTGAMFVQTMLFSACKAAVRIEAAADHASSTLSTAEDHADIIVSLLARQATQVRIDAGC